MGITSLQGEKGPKVRARIMFEIMGNPKEHIVKTLKDYLETLKQDKELAFRDEFIAEPEEQGNLWSTFAEMEITFPHLDKLTWLCINFTPASIDIIEPAEFRVADKEMTDHYNDLLSRLHEVGVVAKNLTSENDLLKLNMNHLVRNSVLLALKNEPQGLDAKGIGLAIGVEDEAAIAPFLDAMQKENRIRKENGLYSII